MSSIQTQTWIESFSFREIEILRLISDGLSNHEISQKLLLSPETIKWYNKQIFGKLGAKSRTQAANLATTFGLLESQNNLVFDDQDHRSNNLPSQISTFVGRVREIAEIRQFLKSSRLVVLTGPGGCGKSRLALEVASELKEAYRDGVWLIEFASINDPSLVANAMVQALQINAGGDVSLIDVLKRFLARKHLLLILDNLEHLADAHPLVGELLAAAPQVTVMATSRERLYINGEQEYPVHPLNLPDLQKEATQDQLLACEAIDLFVQRARAIQPVFSLDGTQLSIIAHICIRLDGLPLAIELAASMVKTHPLQLLAQRLDNSLDTLPSGPRDLPARQRTLRDTLDWSYNLLREDEKILFSRLAVFSAGSTLEGILAVCCRGMDGDPIKVLSGLVEKNLVYTRQSSDGELRFMMLETIHEYAAIRLSDIGESETIRILHAEYFTHLAELAEAEIHSSRQEYWFARLRVEQDNLQSVFLWSFDTNENQHGLRLAALLHNFWFYNGLAAEGRRWTDLGNKKSINASPVLRAGVLRSAGRIALALGDLDRGKELLYQAVELYQQLGDECDLAWSMIFLGSLFESHGEISQGLHICEQGLELFRKLGYKPGIAHTLNTMGELARYQGDYESSRRYYEESLLVASETGERQREAVVINNLSFISFHQQDYRLALEYAQRCLAIVCELNNEYRQACFIATSAGPLTVFGLPERAALLLGASYARFDALGTHHDPVDQAELELFKKGVRDQIGEKAFQEAWSAGQKLTLKEAVAIALSELNIGD